MHKFDVVLCQARAGWRGQRAQRRRWQDEDELVKINKYNIIDSRIQGNYIKMKAYSFVIYDC